MNWLDSWRGEHLWNWIFCDGNEFWNLSHFCSKRTEYWINESPKCIIVKHTYIQRRTRKKLTAAFKIYIHFGSCTNAQRYFHISMTNCPTLNKYSVHYTLIHAFRCHLLLSLFRGRFTTVHMITETAVISTFSCTYSSLSLRMLLICFKIKLN